MSLYPDLECCNTRRRRAKKLLSFEKNYKNSDFKLSFVDVAALSRSVSVSYMYYNYSPKKAFLANVGFKIHGGVY